MCDKIGISSLRWNLVKNLLTGAQCMFFTPSQEPFNDLFAPLSSFPWSSPMLHLLRRSKAEMPRKGEKWAIKLGLIEDDTSLPALFTMGLGRMRVADSWG